jgi:sterol desaturase/sphingolipid hydroxylase (fatty acid hydroxylase superfamily)
MLMRATPESPRMFESDFIDLFSRTPWTIVPILFVPGAAFLFWGGLHYTDLGVVAMLGLTLAGFVFWTFSEYWLHRLFFHWEPPGKWGERLHFLVHGVHHKWPKDKYRLVMPPAVSIALYFIFGALFYFTIGPRLTWGVHCGYVIGYMFYDITHYYIHHFNPKSAYGLRLKKNHMLHHFKSHDERFGVSNMVWDKVFGTTGTAPGATGTTAK